MEAVGILFTAEGPRGVGALTSSSAGPEVQYGVIKLFVSWVSKTIFFHTVRVSGSSFGMIFRGTDLLVIPHLTKWAGFTDFPKSRSHVKILDLRRVV